MTFSKNNAEIDVGFITLSAMSTINIIKSTFKNCSGTKAALLYSEGSSIVNIENSTIENAYSPNGTIITSSVGQGFNVKTLVSRNNSAENELYILKTPSIISESNFTNGTGRYIFASGSTL